MAISLMTRIMKIMLKRYDDHDNDGSYSDDMKTTMIKIVIMMVIVIMMMIIY